MPSVSADDDWSSPRSVIVGRAANSDFSCGPPDMVVNNMASQHVEESRPNHPFPEYVSEAADAKLDQLATILKHEGVKLYRPKHVDWGRTGGYMGSMPRDRLLTVGTNTIEPAYGWSCRDNLKIMHDSAKNPAVQVIRAPVPRVPNTIYEGPLGAGLEGQPWVINNIHVIIP